MKLSFASKIDGEAKNASSSLGRWFPMPRMLMPPSAGIDISDSSVKWLVLSPYANGLRVSSYGEVPLEPGIVNAGIIQNGGALTRALQEVRSKLGGVRAAHAALPEEAAYVFSMLIPHATPREQVLRMIEFEFEGRVPILPSAAVYDYTPIFAHSESEQKEISVVVFPKDVAQAYVNAFENAGITLLSLEVEARSIARAVSTGTPDEAVTLIVDFGRERTGFAVLKHGVPIFTSTVQVGGDAITHALTDGLHMSLAEAAAFKKLEGLSAKKERSAQLEAIAGTVGALAEEVTRHYHYWDTRRNDRGERVTPVGKVILVGGNANLRGLAQYIAAKVQAEVSLGECWQNVADFDEYIPPIDQADSLQYATAIGLALRARI